jgi:hypothetical protein
MLSSLPKLADRNFILGQLLPALLFAVAGLFLFRDKIPTNTWTDIMNAKDLGKTAYLLLAVWVLAVTALILNFWIYRFLEGYLCPAWLSERLKERHRKRLRRKLCELQILYDRWAKEGIAFPQGDLDRYQELRWELLRSMPSRESDVLPTRFGNAIKAFELYPNEVYGADGVVIWLRLVSVVPKSFAQQIQDMRTQVDCLINCCLFSGLITLLGAFRMIFSDEWRNIDVNSGTYAFLSSIEKVWIVWIIAGAVGAYLFYRWALACVPAWGELVMSAFDCYLPALAAQLGFELPETEPMRRQFWITFSQQLIYRRGPDGRLFFRIEDWKKVAYRGSNEETSPHAGDGDGSLKENDDESQAEENDDDDAAKRNSIENASKDEVAASLSPKQPQLRPSDLRGLPETAL